jgi:CheY-like chemotaxis protein
MSKKALIIDEDEMTIMSLKNLLKQGGYEFEVVENGNDGVEKKKHQALI